MIEVKDGHHIFPGDVVMAEKKGSVNTITLDSGKKMQVNDEVFEAIIEYEDTPELQNKTVSPSTSQQTVIADDGYQGLDTVTVNAVDSTIDSNIVPENIKKDVTILGVTGTVTSGIKIPNTKAKFYQLRQFNAGNTGLTRYIYTLSNTPLLKILDIKSLNTNTNEYEDLPDGTYGLSPYRTTTYETVVFEVKTIDSKRYIQIKKASDHFGYCVPQTYKVILVKFDYEDPSISNNIIVDTNGGLKLKVADYDESVFTTITVQSVSTSSKSITMENYNDCYTDFSVVLFSQSTGQSQQYVKYWYIFLNRVSDFHNCYAVN